MAKTFLTNINLKGNQLLNAVIHSALSAPSALAAGQLYFNTGDSTFYYSTGTGTGNWEPVGVQYISSVGSNLSVTDGQLNVDLTGLATETYVGSQGFITSAGQYIQSVGSNLSVNGSELDISGTPEFTSINLTGNGSGNNITVGDDAYIGDLNVSNHIAITGQEDGTKGGIVFGSAKTESISSNGTDLTLVANNDIILLPGSDYAYLGTPQVNGSNRIATLGDISSLGAVQSVSGTTDQITATELAGDITLSLPSYINIPDGEMHLKKTEYWTGDNSNQYGIIAANPYSNEFSIASVNYPLHLESHTGDITLSPNTNNVYVNGNLTTSGGNYNITASNNVYAASGLYAGGSDYENDGVIRVKDYNGENVFSVTADGNANGGQAVVEVKGQFDVYRPGAGGNKVAQISGDGDDNLVINAYQNNLILQSDNNNSVYVGSVVSDNKVITFADLTAAQSGLTWKQAVNVKIDSDAATAMALVVDNGYLTSPIADGILIIDGHTLVTADAGYRILVTGTETEKDGIWVLETVANLNWTASRAIDADAFAELKGAAVFVEEGTKYASTSWVQNNHYITDFTGQMWAQFSGQGTYIGSNSILIDGNQVSVILDSDSLKITGSGLSANLNSGGAILNDSGLYVNTGPGLYITNNEVQVDYEGLENQLATDGFVKTTDISTVTRKYTGDITGNAADSTFLFEHGLQSYDVVARVYQTSSGTDQYADVEVDVKRTNQNTITISFASAPAAGENYAIVIIG